MNLRQWARATQRVLASHAANERQKNLSISDVEWVLRVSISTLADTLADQGDLTLDDLGRLWIEEKQSYIVVSNLQGEARRIKVPRKRLILFRASARLLRNLNRSS